jgi:hypothetical protein
MLDDKRCPNLPILLNQEIKIILNCQWLTINLDVFLATLDPTEKFSDLAFL